MNERGRRLLLTAAAGLLTLPPLGVATEARASADSCAAGMRSDFNGDGRSDALVGDPGATVNGQAGAGRIVVLYGDADGLVGEGARSVLWQGAASVAGTAEAGDQFGYAIATADVNCDGFTDAVAGTPFEDIGGQADSGYVQVIWGAASGLGTGAVSTQYTQASFGQPVTAGDQFGYAVDLVEDLGQGGTPAPDAYALAIGVPGANVNGHNDAGAFAVRAAYDGGTETFWITQDTPGVVGAAEPGDRFGAALACGYLSSPDNVTDIVDCAVGAPREDIGSKADAGSVIVVEEIYYSDELSSYSLDQDAPGVPGTAEKGDRYGSTVDAIRVGSASRLAVGAPGEDIGSDADAGLVQLFSSDRRDISIGTSLTQDTAGVGDSAEPGDEFGGSLAWIAPGLGDTHTRLAVGVPGEKVNGYEDAGQVQVFPIDSLGSEVTYTQDSAGFLSAARSNDRFGERVSTVFGATERVLLIGSPTDTTYATGLVHVVPFGGGAVRSWRPGAGGIPAAGADRFGGSLAGVPGGTT